MTIELDPVPDYPPDSFERTPPQDVGAEQSVLGACILSARARTEIFDILDPAAFYQPRHATIYNAIARMQAAGEAIDPITLNKHLADSGELVHVGGMPYVSSLPSMVPTAANGEYYAEIVQDRALRRGLIELGTSVAQMGYSTDWETSELIERTVTMARDLRDRGMAAEDLPTEDILDFVQHEDVYDWIVPGLIERGDRLILTASEGGGKSTLLRQMAVTLTAGLHPFRTWEYIDPVRVLVLDCENSASSSRRKYRPLLDSAAAVEQPVRRGMFHIECEPSGLDLTKPKDRAWMMRRVEKIKPDVLIIGPVYRLHAGDPNSEELARKVSVVIDEARATAGCAVLMEAHSPHQNSFSTHRPLRPLGSSLWLRWPEFGFGLRPVEDEKSASNADGCRGRRVVPWRGQRDEREWPHFLKAGDKWPWVIYKPIDTDDITGYSQTGAIW
ncbi:DnaB-like helicase N-terminal domain-containing protein [Streptomyces odontomachi]|uniref:DnaB-like helicase N-terminal domain-containing protein n=1 Tax=Streptomyces odontomachi TaxID=2944940 RepID=UPI00210A331A|nr:DnaB-like helicase N-terminal domain-containing protein [Streptomyces sp. ODS25]